jgi:hypothetical protein
MSTEGDEWITRDGRRMRTSEMTEGHLANALALFERRRLAGPLVPPWLFVDLAGADRFSLVEKRLAKLRAEDARRGSGPMRALADVRIRAGLAP